MRSNQLETLCLDDLVPANHPYRRLRKALDFEKIVKSARVKIAQTGAIGFGRTRLIMCLILQFMEDLSDRQFDRYLKENTSGKWFCDFGLSERTPDFTTLCKFRNLVGTSGMERIFKEVNRQLSAKSLLAETFTFVDATALISKLNLWEERDRAIAEGYEKLNNETLPEIAVDPEAKIGAKTRNKFWYGFKKHVAVDCKSGMITAVSVTPANVSDAEGVKAILPKRGAVLGDKGFVGAIDEIRRRGLHSMVILRANMAAKNRDLDRFITKVRAPFEGVFSKQNRRVRYRGTAKNQGAEYLFAVAYNFRKLLAVTTA